MCVRVSARASVFMLCVCTCVCVSLCASVYLAVTARVWRLHTCKSTHARTCLHRPDEPFTHTTAAIQTTGAALQRAGETEVSVGARFSDLTRDVERHFMEPLKQFVQQDLKKAAVGGIEGEGACG